MLEKNQGLRRSVCRVSWLKDVAICPEGCIKLGERAGAWSGDRGGAELNYTTGRAEDGFSAVGTGAGNGYGRSGVVTVVP